MGFLLLLFTTLFALQFADARVLDHFQNAALSWHNPLDLDAVAIASSGETTPGDGSDSKAPAGIKKVAPIEGNADILDEMLNSDSNPGVRHMSINDGIESNILSSGPSPGVGNGHTSAIAGTQSQSGIFNKLPSGPSPGVGHKVTNGYTEIAQTVSITQESDSDTKKSAMMMNKLPSGPSPGVGNSATNGRNTMEKMSKEDEERKGIQTFNRLPSGPSPGVGHSYPTAHLADQIQTVSASEYRKATAYIPIFPKLPGGPSPGGGHSYVVKSASTVRNMELSSMTLMKTSSSPSPGDGNSKPSGSRKKTVEQTGEALDRKIGCDAGSYMDRLSGTSQFFEGSNFYSTPAPPMFGIAVGGDSRISNF